MDLQSQQFLPPQCDHWMFDQQFGTSRQELEQARRTPRVAGTDEELRQESDEMTRHT